MQLPLGTNEDDVFYTPMPLYHTAAFAFGFLNTLRMGKYVIAGIDSGEFQRYSSLIDDGKTDLLKII